jgi:regulator of protease activity HflC (stomatin/prohibitin superfamily)
MIPALLFALVLAQAQDPVATSPRPMSPEPAPVTASSPAADESDIPKGAPTDDYGLVAWCRGALTGHMALYSLVKPEMKSMERPGEVAYDEKSDAAQMEAGREYLALYARAMQAAEKADPKLVTRGLELRSQGEGIWTEAKAAAPRTRMWSWLMWDLPGECEVSANRLIGAPTLRTPSPQ